MLVIRSPEAKERKRLRDTAYCATNRQKISARKREYYLRTREAHLAKMRVYHVAHRDERRAYMMSRRDRTRSLKLDAVALRQAFVDAARAGGCVDCGNKHLGVLESDHVRGIKVANVSHMVAMRVPFSRLFAELDKCETRCANCHALVTVARLRAA